MASWACGPNLYRRCEIWHSTTVAPQDDADAREELRRVKRLDEVVLGASLEGGQPPLNAATGAEDDGGNLGRQRAGTGPGIARRSNGWNDARAPSIQRVRVAPSVKQGLGTERSDRGLQHLPDHCHIEPLTGARDGPHDHVDWST